MDASLPGALREVSNKQEFSLWCSIRGISDDHWGIQAGEQSGVLTWGSHLVYLLNINLGSNWGTNCEVHRGIAYALARQARWVPIWAGSGSPGEQIWCTS